MLKDKKYLIPFIIQILIGIFAIVLCIPEIVFDAENIANNHDRELFGTLIALSSGIGIYLVAIEAIVPAVYMISAIFGAVNKRDKAIIKRNIVLFFISGAICVAVFLAWFATVGAAFVT